MKYKLSYLLRAAIGPNAGCRRVAQMDPPCSRSTRSIAAVMDASRGWTSMSAVIADSTRLKMRKCATVVLIAPRLRTR